MIFNMRGNQDHPHDLGSVHSPRNDTPMTLSPRQVDTILIAQLTNQHAIIKYLQEPMQLCYDHVH
jgi:hypothetical protein